MTHKDKPHLSPLCSCRGLAADEKQSAVELDAVLQHHQDMQEKLAEEMLGLARSLKNNTLAAQNVIKQDNQVMLESARLCRVQPQRVKRCSLSPAAIRVGRLEGKTCLLLQCS